MHILIGALVGAAVGVLGAVVAAKIQGKPITWQSCAAAAIGGAVAGAVTVASLGSLSTQGVALGTAIWAFGAGGAAGGLSSTLASNAFGHERLTKGLLAATLVGGLSGAVGGATMGLASPFIADATPAIAEATTPVVARAASAGLTSMASGIPGGAVGNVAAQVIRNAEDGAPITSGVARAAENGALGGVGLGVLATAGGAVLPPQAAPGAKGSGPTPPSEGIAQVLDPEPRVPRAPASAASTAAADTSPASANANANAPTSLEAAHDGQPPTSPEPTSAASPATASATAADAPASAAPTPTDDGLPGPRTSVASREPTP